MSTIKPQLFKGIALFTPGGDLIYCIDPSKCSRWHLHLCACLQEMLDLPEPPHFLVPGYTATVDRWIDPHSQQLKTLAELYPAVQRYQPLLNALFGIGELVWQIAPWQEELCNPIVLETYRDRFPQLWQDHDLIVRFEPRSDLSDSEVGRKGSANLGSLLSEKFGIFPSLEQQTTRCYVLRLFVSGNSNATERTLESIHQLLEQGLDHPYTLKVIDISKHPELAETNQVSAAPTLVRIWPQPIRRIVGELKDTQRILQILTTC